MLSDSAIIGIAAAGSIVVGALLWWLCVIWFRPQFGTRKGVGKTSLSYPVSWPVAPAPAVDGEAV